ncbi:MAG: hypothetical protein IAA72_08785 [Spirochaetes bacterium]|uniref:Uncharacterized protein n=1 Tax=Candidatus Ornithospirochaeta stercoravium TaxID=2840897 RepID=A0A9D9NE25_9SPIO|nr:hypothetical protein [Candidatus Ornithospirochaeta stercoravium]
MSTQYRTIQNSFIGGLLSALQEGAVGSAAYSSGLSIAENVLYDTASVFRRYGTKFGTMAKSADSVFFRYWKSEDEIYMLECWDKGARLISRDGKAASNEVVTPYLASELRTLSVVSNMGELYVVHRNHKPAKMTVTEPETEGSLLVLSAPVDIAFVAAVPKPETPQDGDDWTVAKTFDSPGDYPSEQLFYGGRWWLMSTDNDPLMIWGSRTMDAATGTYRFNDFTLEEWHALKLETEEAPSEEEMTAADCAIAYQSSDMYGTRIRWALSHQSFLVGAGMSIYQYTGGAAISAVPAEGVSTFSLTQAVALGASGDKAVAYNSYVFFAGIGGHSLMCMNYSQQYSSYTGTDISVPVADYLRAGIKTICITEGSPAVVWVLTNDGKLLACSFSDTAGMIAWSIIRFTDDDHPLWIEAMESDVSRYATLFLVMDRAGKNTIETLEMVPGGAAYSVPFLDCYTISPEIDDEGMICLPELAERSVEMVESIEDSASGIRYSASLTGEADEDGYITLDSRFAQQAEEGTTITAGLKYMMIIGTLRSELPANGTSQSALRVIKNVTFRLYNSLGGNVTIRPSTTVGAFDRSKLEDEARPVLYRRYGEFRYGELEELFTGDISTSYKSSNTDDDRVAIYSDSPYPFCICALIIDHSIQEG